MLSSEDNITHLSPLLVVVFFPIYPSSIEYSGTYTEKFIVSTVLGNLIWRDVNRS